MKDIGERIKSLREKCGLSQSELAHMTGYRDRSSIAKVESGRVNLTRSKIAAFAKALRVSPAVIMGWEDALPANMDPLGTLPKIPLVGQIACGTPILAEQNIEDYVDLPRHIRADYALTCKGDSMIGAGIHDGDVVYVRKQEAVNNGQIAAVLVDGDEATLKRFYYDGEYTVTLVAENPAVPPLVFSGEDINRQRVIGLAVAFTHPVV